MVLSQGVCVVFNTAVWVGSGIYLLPHRIQGCVGNVGIYHWNINITFREEIAMASDLTKNIADVVDKIASDIKVLSKDYGVYVVVFLLALYVWKKVK